MIALSDLIERFGETEIAEYSDAEAHRTVNVQTVQRAIDDAEAEAGSYIRMAGLAQVVRPSAALRGFVCATARSRSPAHARTDSENDRYHRAVAWLKEAAKHPAMLDDAFTEDKLARETGCAVLPNTPPRWADAMGD